jgi:hypothetical protein
MSKVQCQNENQWVFPFVKIVLSVWSEKNPTFISVSPCTNNPCENGGTCSVVDGVATCDCLNNWSGNTCTGKYWTW